MNHGSWVWDVAFSPDGSRLATASADGTARIWSTATVPAEDGPLLADLLEAIVRKRATRDGAIVPFENDSLLVRIRRTLAAGGSYGRSPAMQALVRWLFTDPRDRPVNPATTMTYQEYERRMRREQ